MSESPLLWDDCAGSRLAADQSAALIEKRHCRTETLLGGRGRSPGEAQTAERPLGNHPSTNGIWRGGQCPECLKRPTAADRCRAAITDRGRSAASSSSSTRSTTTRSRRCPTRRRTSLSRTPRRAVCRRGGGRWGALRARAARARQRRDRLLLGSEWEPVRRPGVSRATRIDHRQTDQRTLKAGHPGRAAQAKGSLFSSRNCDSLETLALLGDSKLTFVKTRVGSAISAQTQRLRDRDHEAVGAGCARRAWSGWAARSRSSSGRGCARCRRSRSKRCWRRTDRRESAQSLVFEVADGELDDGVLPVLGLDHLKRLAAVGEEREVAPIRPQLGLRSDQPGAAHDHPSAAVGRLRDLCLPVFGVVGECLPGELGDLGDRVADALVAADADRVAPAGLLEPPHQRLVPERRAGAQQLLPGGACARNASDQLIDEPDRTTTGVSLAFAQPECAAPRRCRPDWPSAGDTRAAWCTRTRRPASCSHAPRR